MENNNTDINDTPLPERPRIMIADWESIESESGQKVPEEARNIVEATGSQYHLDQWGYSDLDSTALFTAIKDNSEWKLPNGTVLDSDIASPRSLSIGGYLQKYLGTDINIPTLCDDLDDNVDFISGLEDLYESAQELQDHRNEWEHERPTLSLGSFGPDMLGNVYIHLKHTDKSVLQNLPLDNLPVFCEKIRVFKNRNEPDMFTVSLRHERYAPTPEEKREQETGIPQKHAEKAEEIGLLGSNLGTRTSTPAALNELGLKYDEEGTISVRGFNVYLIRYTKEGEERWAAEWSNRVAVDDVVFDSLIFDHKPTPDEVSQGALIVEAGLN